MTESQAKTDGQSLLPVLVIVSGPPAAGKTTLARRLARDLCLPLFTKDDFKERLFDGLGWSDDAWSTKLGLVSFDLLYDAIRSCLAAGRSVMVEANFDATAATPQLHAIMREHPFFPIQVQCVAEGEVLKRRFRDREGSSDRHPGHVDATARDRIDLVLERGRLDPLAIGGPVFEIDTTNFDAVDYDGLLATLQTEMGKR